MEKQRLDKFISGQLGITRSEARTAIKRGRVSVDGVYIRDFGSIIDVENCDVRFDNNAVQYKKYIYIMLNKPQGILSASTDKTRKTVVDLLPENLKKRKLSPVGRLDKDTTGLLIITDDGEFAHRIISPKNAIPKKYLVTLDGPLTRDLIEKFKEGITLADGTLCRGADLVILTENTANLTLYEGKYHEVKRMFGTFGLGVTALHRESIGELSLPRGLSCGEYVEMTKKQLEMAQKFTDHIF